MISQIKVIKNLKQCVFVFKYHEVGYQHCLHTIDAALFENQMQWISKFFNVIRLKDIDNDDFSQEDKRTKAVITFDDGYLGQFDFALPVLQRFGITATFFVSSRYVEKDLMWNDKIYQFLVASNELQMSLPALGIVSEPIATARQKKDVAIKLEALCKYLSLEHRQKILDELSSNLKISQDFSLPKIMMTVDNINTLQKLGMDIGGHSLEHPILAMETPEITKQQIALDKEKLMSLCQQSVDLFAYPNGKRDVDFNDIHMQQVEKSGYLIAVSTDEGAYISKLDNRYAIPRVTPWFTNKYEFYKLIIQTYLRKLKEKK